MISLDQWRATIGSFASCKTCRSCIIINRKSFVSHEFVTCVIVYASLIGMLLIVSGNVELNSLVPAVVLFFIYLVTFFLFTQYFELLSIIDFSSDYNCKYHRTVQRIHLSPFWSVLLHMH